MGLDLVAQRGAVDDLFDEDHGAAGVDEGRSTRRFVAFAVASVPLARAVVVPPLCCIANLWRGRKRSLTLNESIFLVFAGLRGAIAFALARNADSAHRRTLVAATTTVILFTTFVLGGLTRPILSWLRLVPEGSGGGGSGGSHSAVDDSGTRRDDGGELGRRWERLDVRVFQPLFGAPSAAPRSGGELRAVGVELEPLSARGSDVAAAAFAEACSSACSDER